MDRGAFDHDFRGGTVGPGAATATDVDSYAFRVAGIEPTDNTYRDAGEETHRAYWRYIVEQVLELKDKSLAKGLDRFGRPMASIAPSTRARGLARSYTGLGDPDAPPLTPAYGLSRTRALLRGRAFADHAEFFWGFDEVTKQHWGKVLGYHRSGGPHLPVRDVIGLAPSDLAEARHRGQLWWYHYQQGARLEAATQRLGLKQPLTGVIPPPKFVVTGDTDISQYTFGIMATKERTQRAIAEGYHSGFSRKIGGMPTITTMPGTAPMPKPPAPVPAAPPHAAHATIQRAVDFATTHGIKVEPAGAAIIRRLKGEAKAAGIPAAYASKTQTIYINEDHEYWANPANYMSALAGTGWASTGTATHPIVHEIGHALHDRAVGSATYNALRGKSMGGTLRDLIKQDVSEYAATNPLELVAEMYAGLRSGKTYDPRLMAVYAKMQGPSHAAAPGPAPAATPKTAPRPVAAKATLDAMSSKGSIVGKAEHVRAERIEKDIAKAVGGKQLKDNEPLDVSLPKPDGGEHAIEVKSLLKGEKQSISVHDDALLRKVEYAATREPGAITYHTIAIDQRARYDRGKYKANYSGHELYYRRGSGPYSLSSMYRVADEAELRRLIAMSDDELPEKARGSLPSGEALEKLRDAANRAHESRLRKDRARKARLKAERQAAQAGGEPETAEGEE